MIGQQLQQYTDLSEPQQRLLLQVAQLLPFGASLPQQDVCIFTTATNGQILVIGPLKDWPQQHIDKETILLERYEVGLWQELLQSGQSVKGFMERQYGHLARLLAFPIVDNGGKCIGGLAIIHNGLEPHTDALLLTASDVLAETTYMAMMVPQQNQDELYKPLSYQDGIIIFDEAGTILYANEAASHLVDLLGFDRRLVGTSIYGGSLKMSWVKQAIREHRGAIAEEIYGDIIVEQTILPISGSRTKRSFLFLKDKTALRRKEQELLVKNSVIKEIHHRVKNNLQTVAGLLRMEARRSDSEQVKKALQAGVSRIESMALVHEVISHYEEDYIDLRTIAEELIRLLKRALLQTEDVVTCEYVGPSILLSSHRAGYVSLILNELISNSFEHGFGMGGIKAENSSNDLSLVNSESDGALTTTDFPTLKITGVLHEGLITLEVADNGKGVLVDFDCTTSKRLGLQIIRNLVTNELGGTFQMKRGATKGTIVTITFPEEASY
ncbi:sensor histidine kinase [Veillonella sp. R32]|uniref:sensor histidine kinase n=1 Tax=Veillonella sp. R32 TaxID=2021312 RepID=UPI00138966E4|nr:histidine kinase dimerization/phosphoacceptor domain -containing protein [Veillonella sp. R32]KAF1679389.1 histidine kinase [Veillonella sp. R32]